MYCLVKFKWILKHCKFTFGWCNLFHMQFGISLFAGPNWIQNFSNPAFSIPFNIQHWQIIIFVPVIKLYFFFIKFSFCFFYVIINLSRAALTCPLSTGRFKARSLVRRVVMRARVSDKERQGGACEKGWYRSKCNKLTG